MLAQLNSVHEVGKLWEKHHAERQYTAVLFARPDVKFACPFPASIIHNIQVSSSATSVHGQNPLCPGPPRRSPQGDSRPCSMLPWFRPLFGGLTVAPWVAHLSLV